MRGIRRHPPSGTKFVPGFTVAWPPPGAGTAEAPEELPGWWDRVALSGRPPGSGRLRLLGNHVHELLAQDRRGNCREETALLGCPGLAPGGQGPGAWDVGSPSPSCPESRGLKRSQEFTCGHQAPGLLLEGHGLCPWLSAGTITGGWRGWSRILVREDPSNGGSK